MIATVIFFATWQSDACFDGLTIIRELQNVVCESDA